MAGTDQNTNPASLTMDARKFLRAINTSAQARIVFFEDSIKAIGQKVNKNFRLTSLDVNSLIFEDVDQNHYYHADLSRKSGGKIEISNIRPITIVDEQKSESFEKHCHDLVECLSRDDFKGADKAFRTIEVQRFRPSVIPNNGWVTTRDGAAHYIAVESNSGKVNIPAITEAFCEAISEFVELDEDGKVLRCEFPESGEKFDIPINEMTRRRLVAHHMKSVAESAWRSDSYKKLIENIAGNVSVGNVQRSVQLAAKFLKENQEFSLLTADETKRLVDNALASTGQFSSILAEDVATLLYRTNLKVNKDDICESWEKTALKAENAELLHSAKLLESSNNFAADYDAFLGKILNEGLDVQSARAKAYLTTLKVINSIIAKMEGKEDLANQVESMIAELEEPEPSTEIILEAEQLLCSIPDTLVDRIVTLENYTEIPGLDEGPAAGGPAEPAGAAVSLPSKGGGGGGLGGGGLGGLGGPGGPGGGPGGPGGGPAGAPGAPGLEGGEEEEEEGKKPPGEEEEGLPESKKIKAAVIEEMTLQQLSSELDHWKTDGHIYLAEDGFDDCNRQFARYIKRCEELDASQLREQFESLRNVMIETGEDVIDDSVDSSDPYAGIEYGEDVKIDEAYGASMGKPSGHGVPTSGKAPSSPPSAKPASGDHKMGKPQGKGVASKDGGEADYSSGTGQKMDHMGGKGVQGKKLSDAGLPAENEDDPDAGKPKTGGAQMGRPQGKGVAESVGDPEKVKPGTGKQYKSGGKFYGKLDAAIASELKSGDQDDKLTPAKHKAQKGGVAEGKGEVPEAFKAQWKKGGKKEEGEKEESTKCEKCSCDPCECDKKPTTEDVAAILHPYMEGKKMSAASIAEAIIKLKEDAKSNPKLKNALKIVEAYEWDWEPRPRKRLRCDFCDAVGVGEEGDVCTSCDQGTLTSPDGPGLTADLPAQPTIRDVLMRISDDTGEDVADLHMRLKEDPWQFVSIHSDYMDEVERDELLNYGEEGFAQVESQYKGPTVGMRPMGYKKSAINEWLTKEDVATILTILKETEESEVQKLMAIKDPVQRAAAIRKAKEKLDLENPFQKTIGQGAPRAGEEKELENVFASLGSGADYKKKRAAAGLCTCPGRVVKNDRGQCIKCKKPVEAGEEEAWEEAVEILRKAIFEGNDPQAQLHKQYISTLLEMTYNEKKASLQESMLAVFADDESIDKVIDAIVTTMDKKGELSPAAAVEPMMGASMGAEAPPLFGGPEEEAEEAEEAAGGAEEEAEEAEEAAEEAEEEAGEAEEAAEED